MGCVRVNQPRRENCLSPASATIREAQSFSGPLRFNSFSKTSCVRSCIRLGISRMLSCQSHLGGPSCCWKSLEMRYFMMADSQVLARMVGQKSQRRFFESTQTTQLVSGKPGVSASSKRDDHVLVAFRQRAPSILTSSDWRSPEPWNQLTKKSPLGSSVIEDE